MTKKLWGALGTMVVILLIIYVLFRTERFVIIKDPNIRENVRQDLGLSVKKNNGLFYPWETSKFEKVEVLSIHGTVDVKELRYFPNLRTLYVIREEDEEKEEGVWKELENIEALRELENIKYVTVSNAYIQDPIVFENVQSLQLWDCKIDNIENLGKCKELEYLEINRGSFDSGFPNDWGFLQKVEKLERLSLQGVGLSDIGDIVKLEGLKALYLTGNDINSLEGIENLQNLEILSISKNPVNDIERVGTLENLKRLSAIELGISSLDWVKNLKKLEKLYLSSNPIGSVEDLGDLPELVELAIDNCEISDISPLKELKHLEWLDMEGNPIEDYSVLEGMEIETLNVDKEKQ